MTNGQLTVILAKRVMRSGIGRDRYRLSKRRWLPKWRFEPTKIIADAFQRLQTADVGEYFLSCDRNRIYSARVRTSNSRGKASRASLPLAICIVVARAYRIEVEALEHGDTGLCRVTARKTGGVRP
jgi:hypothetical protein